MENIYSTIRDIYSNINSVLSANGRINGKVKLDTKVVFKVLYKLYIKQLSIIINSSLIRIQCNIIKGTKKVII